MNTAVRLDSIVIGSTAKTWLAKKSLLPSLWTLHAEEVDRILKAKVRLTIFFSPASVLKLTQETAGAIADANLIIFDANAYASHGLKTREVIALILHEIGHVVNRPPESAFVSPESIVKGLVREDQGTDEWEADDYARHCGFGAEIQSSIEKYRKQGDQNFLTPHVDERLKRIQEQKPLILHFRNAH